MRTFALDTEAEYDNELSVVTMGPWHYARATNIYLVTIAGEDGYEFVGHPKDVDWEMLRGARIAMANAQFDLTMLEALSEKGIIPQDLGFAEVVDVLDMSRYLGRPGSLKGAMESLLGKMLENGEMDKGTRTNMKGKKWDTMSDDFKAEVLRYAMDDARFTLALWQTFEAKWPWHERELSRQTREMCMRGLPVDVERAKGYVSHLKTLIWEAEQKIPWAKEEDAKILSPKRLAEECRSVGIVPPRSLAQDSEECAAWEDKYGTDYPWIGAMRDWRRCNILLKKVETLVSRIRPDGTFPYGLRYFGSGMTGRWSGDAGFSMLNLPRAEMFGVDLRSLFCAPPGYKFLILDFSSLEPRVGAWLVGDWSLLELLKDPEADIYESHARTTMGYSDPRPLKQYDKEEGTEIRKLAKARCLGAGYGASGAKFVTIAKTMAGLDLNLAEANKVIADFRRQNKRTSDTWRRLDNTMKRQAGRGAFSMELPSGREMVYEDVSLIGDGLSAVTCRTGKMMRTRWWGSKVYENCLAEGTEVRTNRGWIPIEQVQSNDLLWDGEEWVSHDGLIEKGEQEVINFGGVWTTPDHKFLHDDEMVPAEKGSAGKAKVTARRLK